ncbi:MAG: hypothetical protein RSE47_03860 [Acidaminococcaceae bacterium]
MTTLTGGKRWARLVETLFSATYLVVVVAVGWHLVTADNALQRLYGLMALILIGGDCFHLLPRLYYLWLGAGAQQALWLGLGKLVTSLTMTVFYVCLYWVYLLYYGLTATPLVQGLVYLLAVVRCAICLLPQNQWFCGGGTTRWRIYRNLPFLLLGLLIIGLYGGQVGSGGVNQFSTMSVAVSLSFAFYVPVVLFATRYPALGALMLPKTCVYVWIVLLGL